MLFNVKDALRKITRGKNNMVFRRRFLKNTNKGLYDMEINWPPNEHNHFL